MLTILAKLLKALNSETSAWALALAVVLGMFIGITPLWRIHNLIIILAALIFRVNLSLFIVSFGVFSGIAYLLDPWFHSLGLSLLEASSWQGIYEAMYATALGRLSMFNHTITMGSFVIALIAAPIVAAISYWVIANYRKRIQAKIMKLRVVQVIRGSRFWQIYTDLRGVSMKRSIIRWPGLAVFAGFVLLLVAISWLFLDTIIKVTLEHTMGRLNGAEVNIERVEHRWVPLSLTVAGVQVTDPNAPQNNRVQIGEASADISPTELVLGRTLIEQLTMTGIRVNQPRESEGEVYVLPDKEDMQGWANQSWDKLTMSLPSVDEIVSQVDLRTEKVIEEAKTAYEQQEQEVKAAQEALPSEEKIKEYEQKIKQITEGKVEGLGDIAARKKALDELKESIRADKEAVSNFRDEVKQAKDVVQQQISELKNAPGNDIDRIKSFFSMDGSGLQNVTGLLLGDKAREWSKYVLLAYEQLGPMLARSDNSATVEPVRGEGQRISFADDNAPPEFLIKKARTEFMVGGTVIDVDWQNITHQHNLLGQPTTYQARADNSELWNAFNLNGEMSLTDLGIDARQQWQLKGAQLQNLGLSDSSELSARVLSSLLDSDGTVLVRENKLDGKAMVRMLNLDLEAEGSSKLTSAIAGALKQLQRLDITTNIGGDIQSPSLSFESDLDNQLGDLLTQSAMGEADEKLAEIKADLTAKVSDQLGGQQGLLENLTQWDNESGDKSEQLEELLKAKIEDSLKDKLKGRIFGDS